VILYLILLLASLSVTLAVLAVAQLLPDRPRGLTRQLAALERLSLGMAPGETRAPRPSARLRATTILARLGRSVPRRQRRTETLRDLLVQAGYRRPEALSIFWGARTATTLVAPLAALGMGLVAGADGPVIAFAAAWSMLTGWLGPKLYLRQRAGTRKREIEANLPDALDLLVVCVEAGLGLNQALARVAEEIRHFSAATSDEFVLVNLERRAGDPRLEALRALGDRMQVADLRGLATMLIQADRFGTSIAQALRVHSDTARTKRRQRAEESAAKATVKLMFPIVFCVLPTLFVVVLGPAAISLIRSLAGM